MSEEPKALENKEKEARWSEWASQAQEGDGQAYRELLAEVAQELRGFLDRRVGYLGLTEDCLQEILLNIHRAKATFDPARPFRPWMYAVARNTMIDVIRKQKRVSDNEDLNIEKVLLAPEPEGEEDHPYTDQLKEALATVSPKYREALELLKIQGLTVKEASQKMGVSESAFKVRIHRGMKMLTEKLERRIKEQGIE